MKRRGEERSLPPPEPEQNILEYVWMDRQAQPGWLGHYCRCTGGAGAAGRCSSKRHRVSTFAPTELLLSAEEARGRTLQIYLSAEGKGKWELCLNQTLWPHGLMGSASDICSCASWKRARSTSGATCSLCHPGFSEHLSKHPESLVTVPCFRTSYFRIMPQNMPNVLDDPLLQGRAQRWSRAQRKH